MSVVLIVEDTYFIRRMYTHLNIALADCMLRKTDDHLL